LNGDKRVRVARFNNPITLVKTITIPTAVIGTSDTPGKVTAVSTSDAGDAGDDSDIATGATIKPVMHTHVQVSFQ
jgi:hypothetical protein